MTSLDDIMRMMPAMGWDTATKIRDAIEEYKAGVGEPAQPQRDRLETSEVVSGTSDAMTTTSASLTTARRLVSEHWGASNFAELIAAEIDKARSLDLADVERRFRRAWMEDGYETQDLGGAWKFAKSAILSSGVREQPVVDVERVVRELQVPLFDAVNEYAAACGAHTEKISVRRMNAVVAINDAIRTALTRSGVRVGGAS